MAHTLTDSLIVTAHDFDPGATAPTDGAWIDATGIHNVLCLVFKTIGTGAIDTLTLIGNTLADGTGTDIALSTVTAQTPTDVTAIGEYAVIEATLADFGAAAGDIKGIAASIGLATGTDECVVVYVRQPRFRESGITAENSA